MDGTDLSSIASKNNIGSLGNISIIESNNLGYLHSLYEELVCVKGLLLSFCNLSVQINVLSNRSSELRSSINLTRRHVIDWFTDNNGKEVSSFKKLLDTEERCLLKKD